VGISHLYDAQAANTILDKSIFQKHDIEIEFQNFKHPKYNQLWGDFIPQMSIIDLLFNEGDNSINIIKKGR
jgi:hypothetical protein